MNNFAKVGNELDEPLLNNDFLTKDNVYTDDNLDFLGDDYNDNFLEEDKD